MVSCIFGSAKRRVDPATWSERGGDDAETRTPRSVLRNEGKIEFLSERSHDNMIRKIEKYNDG